MYKKALFTFLTLTLLTTSVLSFLVPNVKAEEVGPWYAPTYQQWYTKVYDQSNPTEIYGERYTNAQVWWIIYSLGAFVQNVVLSSDYGQCLQSLLSDCGGLVTQAETNHIAKVEPSTNDTLTLSSAIFADRPLSGVTYTKDILRDFHIVPTANAQTGFGFSSLTMVQTLWQQARDITYALMILVIIVFAFMIMFRTKISPQAVITVQSALPKVIITLILITFSYAIAGFLIDIMYISIGLITLLFSSSGVATSPTGPAGVFNFFTSGPSNTGIIGAFIAYWILFLMTFGMATSAPGGFLEVLKAVTASSQGVGSALTIILMLIMTIILIFVTIKTIFALIKIFINTILLVIAGPFLLLFGAVSPASGGLKGWIKSLAANLAVYPVTALLFLVAFVFLDAAFKNTQSGILLTQSWAAPLKFLYDQQVGKLGIIINSGITTGATGNTWSPPLTVGTGVGLVWLWLFASLGTIALIPKVAEIVKGFISGKPFAYGTAISEAVGYGTTKPAGLAGSYGQYKLGRAVEIEKQAAQAAGRVPRVEGLQRAQQAITWITGKK
jgi:hypothetical protein